MLNQDLFHLLNQRVRMMNKHLNDTLKQHDLYNAQWSILYYLKKHEKATQREITQYFHVEAPTITRTLKRMEENGWVSRVTGNDKREKLIQLTETALSKYSQIEDTVSEHERNMLKDFTNEEKEQLYQLLQKLG